jgi:hypothetical protein
MRGIEKECIQGLVRKIETNIPLRRPKHRWEDNFKMDLRENR